MKVCIHLDYCKLIMLFKQEAASKCKKLWRMLRNRRGNVG